MQINKINYEQLFPLPQPYSNVRLSIEINMEPGDTTADAFTRGHKEANENFNRLFPQQTGTITLPLDYPAFENGTKITVIEPKQSATERMIAAINSCTLLPKEKGGLLSFEKLVTNNLELQEAYNKKLSELQSL